MENIELDPIQWQHVTRKTLSNIAKDGGAYCTVETAKAMASERCMVNPVENVNIGKDTLVYLNAPPQYGKTTTMLFCMWRSGVQHNMPSIMFTLDREGESKRLDSATIKFNNFVTTCAEVLGVNLGIVPRLQLYDSTDERDHVRFAEGLKRGLAEEIPFCTFMGNSSGVEKAKMIIKAHMSVNVGRDAPDEVDSVGFVVNNGRMNAMVVVDEADKFVQPGTMVKVKAARPDGTFRRVHQAGALEAALNGKVMLNKELHVPQDPTRTKREPQLDTVLVDSLFEAFTSVLLVTATIQAFTTTETPIATRPNIEVIFAKPSNNYWSLLKMDGWGCKLVENRQVESAAPMMADMMSSNAARHGLVAVTSRKAGTNLKSSQESLAVDAAETYPGIVSVVWNGDGIKVYTSSDQWATFLSNTGAFEVGRVGNGVNLFTSKPENKKKAEWKDWLGAIDPESGRPTGGVMNSIIHTYPGLMDFIYSMKDLGADVPHTVLYSLNMSARGTPVKGWGHRGVLTDMFVDIGESGHDEYLIQLAGRLLGIDKRTQAEGKIIWGTRVTLNKLYEAVIAVPFFVSKLKDGVGFPELIRKTTREIYNHNGIMLDTHQVTTKSTVRRTRAGNEKSIVRENKKLKRAQRATNTRMERVETENIFQHVPICQHVAPMAQAVLDVRAANCVQQASSSMEEVWVYHADGMSAAMQAVVVKSGGSATVKVMAESIGAEDGFPDGTSFNMTTFVNTICRKGEVLLKTGLHFENGVFRRAA